MDSSEAVPAPSVPNDADLTIKLTPIEKIWLVPFRGREESCGRVVEHGMKLGVCVRCIFRLLKVTDFKFYREDREVRQ